MKRSRWSSLACGVHRPPDAVGDVDDHPQRRVRHREQLEQLEVARERDRRPAVLAPAPRARGNRGREARPTARAARDARARSARDQRSPSSSTYARTSAAQGFEDRCLGLSSYGHVLAAPGRAERTSGSCPSGVRGSDSTSSSRSGQYVLETRPSLGTRASSRSPGPRRRREPRTRTRARRGARPASRRSRRRATAGWACRSCSISATGTFSPPRLITSLTRPVIRT